MAYINLAIVLIGFLFFSVLQPIKAWLPPVLCPHVLHHMQPGHTQERGQSSPWYSLWKRLLHALRMQERSHIHCFNVQQQCIFMSLLGLPLLLPLNCTGGFAGVEGMGCSGFSPIDSHFLSLARLHVFCGPQGV